jgi:hypothetical protein
VDQKLTAAAIRFTGAGVEAETPKPLFDLVAASGAAIGFNYQPTADGQRFLLLVPTAD